MEVYLKTSLPEYVMEILSSEDDPMIISQDYGKEHAEEFKKMLPKIINNMCERGSVLVFATDKVAIVVLRRTAWLCSFDTKVHSSATARDILKAYKEFIPLLTTRTMYNKAESRTPLEKYAKTFAKATGSEIEGVCRKSFCTSDGKMVDEYIVGIVIERSQSCQS